MMLLERRENTAGSKPLPASIQEKGISSISKRPPENKARFFVIA